jgi:hypothetical protein
VLQDLKHVVALGEERARGSSIDSHAKEMMKMSEILHGNFCRKGTHNALK